MKDRVSRELASKWTDFWNSQRATVVNVSQSCSELLIGHSETCHHKLPILQETDKILQIFAVRWIYHAVPKPSLWSISFSYAFLSIFLPTLGFMLNFLSQHLSVSHVILFPYFSILAWEDMFLYFLSFEKYSHTL